MGRANPGKRLSKSRPSRSSRSHKRQSEMEPSGVVGEAREAFEVIHEMSRLLNCGLNREQLSILISLCENGVNPEALGVVVKELRREASAIQSAEAESAH